MQNNDIKAIVFDLDDTLYPQIEYTRQCLHATADYISQLSGCNVNIILKKLDQILEKNGIEYKFIFNDIFKEINFDGMSYIKEILELFWACNPVIVLYDNVFEILTELKKQYRLAILSDGHENVQHYKIKMLNLENFFEKILITDSLGVENRKPSPAAYQKLLCEMDLKPEECIYIGNDPKKDFLACKNLGIKTVRIRQGDYKNITLDDIYEADYEILDIKYLFDMIGVKKNFRKGA